VVDGKRVVWGKIADSLRELQIERLAFVVSHPSHKGVARMGHPALLSFRGRARTTAKASATAGPFGCASRGEAARGFAQDDGFVWLEGRTGKGKGNGKGNYNSHYNCKDSLGYPEWCVCLLCLGGG
jgi:hypothetical protein